MLLVKVKKAFHRLCFLVSVEEQDSIYSEGFAYGRPSKRIILNRQLIRSEFAKRPYDNQPDLTEIFTFPINIL